MVDGLRVAFRGINPRFEHFQDEKVIGADETSIHHFTFEIRKAFGYQRRSDAFGWYRRQRQSVELRHIAARAITDLDHRGCQLNRWNGDHALSRSLQRIKAVITVADDTGDERGFKIHHHVPRHRHDIDVSPVSSGQQHHRARFDQLVHFRQGQRSYGAQTSASSMPRP
jgi:hypothetical protein